jgi:hypothetical protein
MLYWRVEILIRILNKNSNYLQLLVLYIYIVKHMQFIGKNRTLVDD